ncbi:class I SAM-dependent methyltransferase [Maribacter sp. ACAM166]|nr:class I SAM-dependent methyltransferase [Maribacter sp. ACAM166]
MKRTIQTFLLITIMLFNSHCKGQTVEKIENHNIYSYKNGDSNGIGKWYKGREIAHVMGFQGMGWLERTEREEEEQTLKLLQNMNIQPGDTIADIGAGSGYHVFKMAPIVEKGQLYAVDLQPEMLAAMAVKKENNQQKNIILIQGTEQSVNLTENSIDKVLLVDVYHEFNFPFEMIQSIKRAMRPDAQLYLIEYRGEDASVPIKELHKMTEAQAVSEMKAAGLLLKQNIDNLPWQHCMVFVKG